MHMPRTVGKKYEKLNTQIIELKRIRQETSRKLKHPQATYTQPKTEAAQEMMALRPEGTENTKKWMAMLGGAIEDTQKQMNQIRMDYNKEKWEERRSAPKWQNSQKL
jgi:hypothetical protein